MISGNKLSFLLPLFFVAIMAGCGGGSGGSSSSSSTTTTSASTTTTTIPGVANVLPVTVNGPGCNAYQNEPCVDVTVCAPGTSNCQTISGILLDTASYGLRIFKQAVNVPFTQIASGSGSLAECVTYADGSADWGSVQTASVILGGEPAVQVPVQVIDYTFGGITAASSVCPNADQSPQNAGFNGILGIGPAVQDCGAVCATAPIGMYFSCNGATCSGATAPLNVQLQNPVFSLPTDNNGVLVQLPALLSQGLPTVSGSLILGIGTQANNVPSAVSVFALDSQGEFVTNFNNVSYSSFVDTGSNGLFFASPFRQTSGPYAGLLPNCTGANAPWYCPPSITNLSATITGAGGGSNATVPFQIGNFDNLTNSSNEVFNDIGGNEIGGFDWGLPFYFGRNVFMGIEGTKSSIGNGAYVAY